MPPIPSSSAEYASNPIVVGYIARQLLKGTYSALSDINLARQPQDEQLIRTLVNQLLAQYGPDLTGRFASIRTPRGDDGILRTINGLKRFTLPLSAEASLTLTTN
jgi:hypothetical protein